MLPRFGLQGDFMKVLRLSPIPVVEMPIDGGAGVTVRQFDGDETFASIHLPG